MTTLELADAIATAVIRATQPQGNEPYGDAPTQAVLKTLQDHQSWFCRITYDAHGDDIGETPYEQQELFP